MPRSKYVTAQGSPPAAFISHSCVGARSGFGLGSACVLKKAIVSPEGDQRGCETSSVPRVSCTSLPSLKFERYKLLTRRSFSLSAVPFTQSAHPAKSQTAPHPPGKPHPPQSKDSSSRHPA